jgi:hypothetical protein
MFSIEPITEFVFESIISSFAFVFAWNYQIL